MSFYTNSGHQNALYLKIELEKRDSNPRFLVLTDDYEDSPCLLGRRINYCKTINSSKYVSDFTPVNPELDFVFYSPADAIHLGYQKIPVFESFSGTIYPSNIIICRNFYFPGYLFTIGRLGDDQSKNYYLEEGIWVTVLVSPQWSLDKVGFTFKLDPNEPTDLNKWKSVYLIHDIRLQKVNLP